LIILFNISGDTLKGIDDVSIIWTGHPLQIGIATPQTEAWGALADKWRRLEALGFDSAWVYDHFMAAGGGSVDDTYLEGWTALAGLAAVTSRLQLGVLVSGNTYRSPALLAKQAVTVDQISGGRLVLGLGAGWHEPEHRAFGFPFPPPGERVERFREALTVIKLLFTAERPSFAGRYYSLDQAPFLPRPVRSNGIPILIGTRGQRMLKTVARQADIWNMVGGPAAVAKSRTVFLDACQAVGRDPASLRWSVAAWPNSVGFNPLASPAAFVELVGHYRQLGISEVICMWNQEIDLTAIERIAATLPALRTSR
jgi:F420-dependent oxidoreductase-like protein